MVLEKRFTNEFQSLFYWTSELNVLFTPWARKTKEVSILVLLDFGIKPGSRRNRGSNNDGFQSLFYWTSELNEFILAEPTFGK